MTGAQEEVSGRRYSESFIWNIIDTKTISRRQIEEAH